MDIKPLLTLANWANQAVNSVPTVRSKVEKEFAVHEGRSTDALPVMVTTWRISRILAQLVHYLGEVPPAGASRHLA